MSLLLAQSITPVNTVDMVFAGVGIAEVWGVLVDANDPAQGAFAGSTVRIVYHVEPPNRFWPKTSLKPY